MSWYVYHPKLSHSDWLRLSATERMIDEAAQRSAAKIVSGTSSLSGAIERSLNKNSESIVGAISESTSVLAGSLNEISRQLDSISMSIDDFRADFNWWAEKQTSQLESIKSILESIKESLERRHRTEAFELFAESREYVFHQMYDKALRNIEIAIHGGGAVRGYELEWRFWEHLGFLRLGDKHNNSLQVIDLKKAETAFFTGAKLAEREGAVDGAVRCLLCATQAAYCDGDMTTADSHVRHALRLRPLLPEANWLFGRLSWEDRNDDAAEQAFFDALINDHQYACRFYVDPVFPQHLSRLERISEKLADRLLRHQDVEKPLSSANDLLGVCHRVSTLVHGDTRAPFSKSVSLEDAERALASINQAAKSTKLEDAAFMASAGINRIKQMISDGRNFLETAKSRANEEVERLGARSTASIFAAAWAVFWFFYISCGIFVAVGLLYMDEAPSGEISIGTLFALPFAIALGPLSVLFFTHFVFTDAATPQSARTIVVSFWGFALLGSFAIWRFCMTGASGRNSKYQRMQEAIRLVDRAKS